MIGMFTLQICECVCVNVQFQLRNSKQYRLRTVDVAPQTCLRVWVYWWHNCSRCGCVCASTSFLKPHLFPSENKQKSWHKSWVTVTLIYCCCCCCCLIVLFLTTRQRVTLKAPPRTSRRLAARHRAAILDFLLTASMTLAGCYDVVVVVYCSSSCCCLCC